MERGSRSATVEFGLMSAGVLAAAGAFGAPGAIVAGGVAWQTTLARISEGLSDTVTGWLGFKDTRDGMLKWAVETVPGFGALADAMHYVGYSQDLLTGSVDAAAGATAAYVGTLEDEYLALQDMPNVLTPAEQGERDMLEAKERLVAAQDKINKLVADGKTKTNEYRLAELDLIEAQRRVDEASNQHKQVIQGVAGQMDTLRSKTKMAADQYDRLFSGWRSAPSPVWTNAGNAPKGGRASGGIITRPEVSWIGEDGPEAVIPLSSRYRSEAMALMPQVFSAIGSGGGDNSVHIGTVVVDAKSITELASVADFFSMLKVRAQMLGV
jgi:hypothetical protein